MRAQREVEARTADSERHLDRNIMRVADMFTLVASIVV